MFEKEKSYTEKCIGSPPRVLSSHRCVLHSATAVCVPLCPTSTVCSRPGSSLLGSLPALPPGPRRQLSVRHAAAAVPTHVPAALRWPARVPRSPERGALPRESHTHWDSTCGSPALRAGIQRTIPADGGLLSSGPSSNSDQTFVHQSMRGFFLLRRFNLIVACRKLPLVHNLNRLGFCFFFPN